jgi:hypothetical protein
VILGLPRSLSHYQAHLHQRRQTRPDDEYQPVSSEEWAEFEEHFDKRKVELGSCARPYGTGCQHEHACLTEMILMAARHTQALARYGERRRGSRSPVRSGVSRGVKWTRDMAKLGDLG